MTWLVGTNTFFGHAVIASDICVTFTSNSGETTYIDCLQKVYPLGKFIIGGFAGSVRIGFYLIGHLQTELSILDEGNVWDLDIIANTWLPRVVRRIFNSSPSDEKNLGVSIILASVHPTKNGPFPKTPLTLVYKFNSPNFEPQEAAQNEVFGIGSGAGIIDCMNNVNEICNSFSFHKAIYGGEQYQAMRVADILEREIQKLPLPGVSNLFQFATVNRNKYEIFNHERDIVTSEGRKPLVRFPKIYSNYEEFKNFAKNLGVKAECAIC